MSHLHIFVTNGSKSAVSSVDVRHLRTAWRYVLKLNSNTQHMSLSVAILYLD